MSPAVRHGHEDGIVTGLLPQLDAVGVLTGGGTELSAEGEPVSVDIHLDVTARDISEVAAELTSVIEGNGLGRGSWIEVDGARVAAGSTEYVLLRTRLSPGVEFDGASVVPALQAALGNGQIGWHDETYQRADGPVYVFSGASAAEMLRALGAELPNHEALATAELAVAVGPTAR